MKTANLINAKRFSFEVEGGNYCCFRELPTNRPHVHLDYMEICFVTGGRGLFNHGGQEYPLKENSLFISHPNIVHEISSWETRDLELHFVKVTDSKLSKGEEAHHAVCRNNCYRLKDYIPLLKQHCLAPGAGTELAIRGFAIDALELLRLDHREEELSLFDPAELRHVISYINENLKLPLMVEDLVEKFGLSERTLRRNFNRTTGRGIKQYILSRKMELAGDLLTMHWRINEAAAAVGIDDPAQFSRTFRNIKGVSPREWQGRYIEKSGATFFI